MPADSHSRCCLACDASAHDAKSLTMWVERCEPLRHDRSGFSLGELMSTRPDRICRLALSGGMDWWRMEWPFSRVRKIFFRGRNFLENPRNSAERAIFAKFQAPNFEHNSGVARRLFQGRPLQLPMGWGVGQELSKSWPTCEQLCLQNLALAISCSCYPTKSA